MEFGIIYCLYFSISRFSKKIKHSISEIYRSPFSGKIKRRKQENKFRNQSNGKLHIRSTSVFFLLFCLRKENNPVYKSEDLTLLLKRNE
jgi:hypothetical protein